jgi:hypothetical protein
LKLRILAEGRPLHSTKLAAMTRTNMSNDRVGTCSRIAHTIPPVLGMRQDPAMQGACTPRCFARWHPEGISEAQEQPPLKLLTVNTRREWSQCDGLRRIHKGQCMRHPPRNSTPPSPPWGRGAGVRGSNQQVLTKNAEKSGTAAYAVFCVWVLPHRPHGPRTLGRRHTRRCLRHPRDFRKAEPQRARSAPARA